MGVIERTVPVAGLGIREPELAPIQSEIAFDRQRGRGEDPRPRAVRDLPREDACDRKRRGMKLPAVRRDVEPANPLRVVALAPAQEPPGGLRGTLRAVRQLVASLRLPSELGGERVERVGERVERGGEIRTPQRFGLRLLSWR